MKSYTIFFGLIFFLNPLSSLFAYSFYAGIGGGFGSTTWKALIPREEKQNMAVSLSTPIEVEEGGGMWGAQLGYEFTSHFAIEATYKHYPKATINFSQDSLFAFDNNDRTLFKSYTQQAALMAKIMARFLETNVHIYSSAGVADCHREDEILNQWQILPTFGIGFNYNFSQHFMGEIGGNYTAGYGESELSPADNFLPFLYSIFFSLSYRF